MNGASALLDKYSWGKERFLRALYAIIHRKKNVLHFKQKEQYKIHKTIVQTGDPLYTDWHEK